MAETSAQDAGDAERLHEYWVHGEGAAKIRWGEPGDFDRCVRHLGKYIADPKGYCNLAHHAALGIYPATHAAEDRKLTGRAQVADTKTPAKPYGNVTYADPKNGKYPVDTEAHARAAWSYINMPKNASQYPMNGVSLSEVKDRIRAACKKFGIDISDSDSASNSDARVFAAQPEIIRFHPYEDIHVVSRADGDGSGRLVEAFAAVFNQPAEIQDFEGHYLETIDRTAFNKRLADLHRSKGGVAQVKVLYNHGMTIHGTPSERFSMPVGTPVAIEATDRGLVTRTEYNKTPLAEEILELIRSGSITSQSFTGRIIRSDPQLARGRTHRPGPNGLPQVRRTELGLREYGTVLYPAYDGAEVFGVRMSVPGTWEPDSDIDGTSPDGEAAAGEPPVLDEGDEHSARYHQHALYRLRSQELRESVGLVW